MLLRYASQNLGRLHPLHWRVGAKLGAEIAGRVCQLGFIVLVARTIGTVEFGFYSLAVFSGFVAGQISDGGLHLLTSREEIKQPASLASQTFKLKLWASGLLLPVLGAVALFYATDWVELLSFWVIAYSYVIYSLAEFGFSLLRIQERLPQEALLGMSNRILQLILGLVAALLFKWGLAGFALAQLASVSFTARRSLQAAGINQTWGQTRGKVQWSIWRQAAPLGLGLLLSQLAFRVDVPLLGQFRTQQEVGLYSAAYRLFEPVLVLPASILAGWFPYLVGVTNLPVKFRLAARNLLIALLLLGLGVAFLVALLANWAISWLYGPDYSGSAALLAMLAAVIPFLFLNYGLTHLLIAIRQEKFNVLFFGVALFVNVSANLVLIPLWGSIGAVLTTALTEIVLSGLCLYYFLLKSKGDSYANES